MSFLRATQDEARELFILYVVGTRWMFIELVGRPGTVLIVERAAITPDLTVLLRGHLLSH